MTSEQTRAHIEALIQEREHYVRTGNTERVAAVDASLADFGHKAKAPAKRAAKMTAAKGEEL